MGGVERRDVEVRQADAGRGRLVEQLHGTAHVRRRMQHLVVLARLRRRVHHLAGRGQLVSQLGETPGLRRPIVADQLRTVAP